MSTYFEIDSHKWSNQMTELTKSKLASALYNFAIQITRDYSCRLNLELFARFIRLNSFLRQYQGETGGFSVFLFIPEYFQLSNAQQQKRFGLILAAEESDVWNELLGDSSFVAPRSVDKVIRVLSSAKTFLQDLLDKAPNIASIGYEEAENLVL